MCCRYPYPFAILETKRELEPRCVPQLFLGLLLGMRQSAFSLSLVTVPEVYAKLKLGFSALVFSKVVNSVKVVFSRHRS